MVLVLFKNLTNKDKSVAVERLIKGSTPSQDFFFMIILSILTATFGLLLNNAAVIIGSMLIAPMLYPALSLSLGITMFDPQLIGRSFYTIVRSFAYGIFTAFITSLLFANQFNQFTPEIFLRSQPLLSYTIIAFIAGLAGSFALVKPQLSETLPGIAISVTLIPPIAVVGIGMAKFSWTLISGSLLLFMANTIGIVFAGIITFSLMNFHVKRSKAKETVKEEDRKIKQDVKKAEKENHKK
jgi:uncharacterized hydrophobic protein (TIGR00271 family)